MTPSRRWGLTPCATIFAAGAGLFGIRVTSQTQKVLLSAGERLWVDITTLVRNTVGRRIFHAALSFIEPSVRQALEEVWDDPRLQPERSGIRLHARMQLARFFVPLAGNVLLNMLAPQARRRKIVGRGEFVLQAMRQRCEATWKDYPDLQGQRRQRLSLQADLLDEVMRQYLPSTFLMFISAVAAGMASFNGLRALTSQLAEMEGQPVWNDSVLEVTRGLPNNPTTEMDLRLWAVARAVRSDPDAWQEAQACSPAELAARWQAGKLAPVAQRQMDQFIEVYGGRGLAEIDLGRARWREEPLHLFEVLGSYLQMADGEEAPDAVFARGAQAAQATLERLVSALRHTRGGWVKAGLARFFGGRARALMGARESPKFFAVRLFGLVRRELLASGALFVQAGELDQPDDLIYLSFAEIRAFAAGEPRDWRGLIAARRAIYARELQRRQLPRLLLSDGRAFYAGMHANGASGLTGSPVSPGLVEGSVRVVLDPRQANLLPGEILVCPGTDPSWTPLFLSAGGLIMEVGGHDDARCGGGARVWHSGGGGGGSGHAPPEDGAARAAEWVERAD